MSFAVRKLLPRCVSSRLFGDRKKFGVKFQPEDPCWKAWEKIYWDFHYNINDQVLARRTNHAGYSTLSHIDLSGKKVLEVGPGDMHHIQYWRGIPMQYTVADVMKSSLERAEAKLKSRGINYQSILLQPEGTRLPFDNGAFDIIIAISTLEHLYPISAHLDDMLRLLKKNGRLVGSIPCEGGLAWGMGRFLTSRRWIHENTSINYDKIISWEHPNFADDIIKLLDSKMDKQYLHYWPLDIPSVDLNLVARFVYRKP